MVTVLVRIDDVADRFIGERFYFDQNAIMIVVVLVIDQNHAFPGEDYRDISSSAADFRYRRDLIEILPDLV